MLTRKAWIYDEYDDVDVMKLITYVVVPDMRDD